ncbi:unnamed protein product [Paramecium octaurelia]|uniref:Protein kinase domain-containing protein n=1 Tax=Paramecium octaurelia TaxID=43137 RepID=A0A8S1X8C5_PAROT|nr:unnamed protein product [Paramecium octaurelia]
MKQLSLLNLVNIQPKQTTLYSTKDSTKKIRSFDIIGRSPYKINPARQTQKQLIKECPPITSRATQRQHIKSPPDFTKSNKPISISNHLDLHQNETQTKGQQKSYHLQLKSILIKEQDQLHMFDQAKRINTQITSNLIPQITKLHLRTHPEQIDQEVTQKLPSTLHNTNLSKSEKLLQQNQQKFLDLQNKITSNIKQRNQTKTYSLTTHQPQPTVKQLPDQFQLPQTAQYVLQHYSDRLSEFERKEIIDYETIYYLAPKNIATGQRDPLGNLFNYGYDNQHGDYRFIKQDQIAFRYEMLDKLGNGSFGYVFKVFDHKHRKEMAIKIIKNREKFYQQALIEIDLLKIINKADNSYCLIKLMNFFEFRNHIVRHSNQTRKCMVFELLCCNLYEFVALNNFVGLEPNLIRRFAIQILQALLYLKACNIIHCDLKPENILLKEFTKSGLKVIDFGSSCFANNKMYTYIQSRFYRAPEIIFGINYTFQIDMWSFGCIIAELFLGDSLFQSKTEKELLYAQTKVLGMPPKEVIDQSPRRSKFFDDKYQLNYKIKENEQTQQLKPLPQLLDKADADFYDFISKCLEWNQFQRLTPEQALEHPWIVNTLPQAIRNELLQKRTYVSSITANNKNTDKQELK